MEVEIKHQVGALRLNISFATGAPWTTLFGASGSGKTTVLRTIAGFVRPDAGRIMCQGRPLLDTEWKVFIPAHHRSVRSAAQTARLFPRLNVRDNLLYGASAAVVDEVAELFRLGRLTAKMPHALSGGERQRVSVARAVASAATAEAGLLLLDEPFVGMDYALRDTVALELRAWLSKRGVPVLSVTHDVSEAFLLDAELVRLTDGHVTAQGSASAVLAEERARILLQLNRLRDRP